MKTMKFEDIEIGGHFLSASGLHYRKTSENKAAYGSEDGFYFASNEIVTPIKWTGGDTECVHFKPIRWTQCFKCAAKFEFIPADVETNSQQQ